MHHLNRPLSQFLRATLPTTSHRFLSSSSPKSLIVIGTGVAGSSTALKAAEEGLDVTLISAGEAITGEHKQEGRVLMEHVLGLGEVFR
jgi:heterodisulfide reductase subunit A-like polyferredoxin